MPVKVSSIFSRSGITLPYSLKVGTIIVSSRDLRRLHFRVYRLVTLKRLIYLAAYSGQSCK